LSDSLVFLQSSAPIAPILQLEVRTYTRKDGSEARRGPYWYYHYRGAVGRKPSTLVRLRIQSAYWIVNSPRFYFGEVDLRG
jgi:hypothetical protein